MKRALLRLAVFLVVLAVPLYWLYLASAMALGPDPGKWLLDHLGQGALVLLLLTLSMTPLNRLTGWPLWMALRRQLGLWAFAYACLHVAAFILFILGGDLSQLLKELPNRPYVLVGALAFSGLIPLALTSNRWSMRTLGKRWKRLHRLVYLVVVLALLHMLWVVRSDLQQWALYAGIAGCLLLMRTPLISPWFAQLAASRRGRPRKVANNP
ncbi:protein-methionine-sulfoxide reductase heme-binding subunit MsrQ [Pseudomonas sp.]|uniref:protein-methionine-sulfoxide reductase heme-binding subunit MsrQ n=1 Tax=Pseudomonas sp. TaxID=306 RepID=UPI001A0AD1BA|nr:protein-methionine-sulfoxide reductase heme-binding subunit MsrQ [Pseudomonas sp.]MBF0674355.1 protein-methionine-sulfoxide reductase heme-binding subunit MsrQ [Pseudomonas sp.]